MHDYTRGYVRGYTISCMVIRVIIYANKTAGAHLILLQELSTTTSPFTQQERPASTTTLTYYWTLTRATVTAFDPGSKSRPRYRLRVMLILWKKRL